MRAGGCCHFDGFGVGEDFGLEGVEHNAKAATKFFKACEEEVYVFRGKSGHCVIKVASCVLAL